MNVIALVPARGGSKGFPNKNIAEINGKSLIELAVQVGLDCEQVDDVYISTDSTQYEKIACDAGARSLGLRPADLATDTAKNVDVAIDLLAKINRDYDYLVLLQPTSPLRHPSDISRMLETLEKTRGDAMATVEKLEDPHPYKLKSISQDEFITPFLPDTTSEVSRQLLPDVYKLTGAIYIARCDIILSQRTLLPATTRPYYMHNTVNIDTEFDYQIILGLLESKTIKLYGA